MKVIYLRTSTEEQNPLNQLKDCESLSGKDYALFEDKQSAWKDKDREGFDSMKDEINKNNVSDLYVWDFDRLYRNRIKLKEFIQYCKAHHCRLWSYRQKFINQIQELNLPKDFEFIRDMMLNNLIELLGWIAEDESKKKSERVKISIRKEQGITKSYRGNKWGRRTLPEQTKQAIIEAFKKNLTYSEICSQVKYFDKNRNEKNVSRGFVHKTISEFKEEKNRFNTVQEREQ